MRHKDSQRTAGSWGAGHTIQSWKILAGVSWQGVCKCYARSTHVRSISRALVWVAPLPLGTWGLAICQGRRCCRWERNTASVKDMGFSNFPCYSSRISLQASAGCSFNCKIPAVAVTLVRLLHAIRGGKCAAWFMQNIFASCLSASHCIRWWGSFYTSTYR